MLVTGTQYWTPARIARDRRTTVQEVERAAIAAEAAAAATVNGIPYYDDAGRGRIERAMDGEGADVAEAQRGPQRTRGTESHPGTAMPGSVRARGRAGHP